MKTQMGGEEIVPTALLIDKNGMEPRFFTIQNDGIEEDIKSLSDEISQMDITAIILVSEMWIKKEELEGLSVVVFNEKAAFMDIIPFFNTSYGIQFGEIKRIDVTNNFDEIGALSVLYKNFIENKNKQSFYVSPFVQNLIDTITVYVQKNRSRCPDLDGVATNDVVAHLLLSEAMNMFVADENKKNKNYAGEIFIYLEKNRYLKDNLSRILSYFIGLMYKDGLLVEKNILMAMQYFLHCIGNQDSKNGFLMYERGENNPIEIIIGNLDDFIRVAKIQLGNLIQI